MSRLFFTARSTRESSSGSFRAFHQVARSTTEADAAAAEPPGPCADAVEAANRSGTSGLGVRYDGPTAQLARADARIAAPVCTAVRRYFMAYLRALAEAPSSRPAGHPRRPRNCR